MKKKMPIVWCHVVILKFLKEKQTPIIKGYRGLINAYSFLELKNNKGHEKEGKLYLQAKLVLGTMVLMVEKWFISLYYIWWMILQDRYVSSLSSLGFVPLYLCGPILSFDNAMHFVAWRT